MRLFISQPMRGKTDEQILDERNYAISRAKKILGDDVEVRTFQQTLPHSGILAKALSF